MNDNYVFVDKLDEEGLQMCLITGAHRTDLGKRILRVGYTPHAPGLGVVYLAESAIGHLADAIGRLPESDAQDLRDQLAAANAENDQLRRQITDIGSDSEKADLADKIVDSFTTMIVGVEQWMKVERETAAEVPAA